MRSTTYILKSGINGSYRSDSGGFLLAQKNVSEAICEEADE